MDGIHVASREGCDDGNSIEGDGCNNKGEVETFWSWDPDILRRSICVPQCSNSKVEVDDEECDDTNRDEGDGWDYNWLVEDGWQCFNGSSITRSYCYEQPVASIESISNTNEIKVVFTNEIEIFDIGSYENGIGVYNFSISGPVEPYKYKVQTKFIDNKTLMFNVTVTSVTAGEDEDKFIITLNQAMFKNKDNPATLYNSLLEDSLKKVPIMPDVVEAFGAGVSGAMTATMVTMVASNIIMGGSSELLWGFMNTIQMIFFFPVLSSYFPDNCYQFFTYFAASKMQIKIGKIEELKSNIKGGMRLEDRLKMPALNSRWEDLEYESTSILVNADDIMSIMTQGILMCSIVFAVRALLFTTTVNVEAYEEEIKKLNEMEANRGLGLNPQNQSTTESEDEENLTKKQKASRWFRRKIRQMSYEYKYNFFLRMGIELYLEVFVLSLLNLRYPRFDNLYWTMSSIVSGVLIIWCFLFLIWSTYISCSNYLVYRNKGRVDIPQIESMFGEYKTKFLPQIMFNTYFMLRRIGYACLLIFGEGYPIAQAFSFWMICVPILAYQIVMNPYIFQPINVVMNINECLLVVLGGFLFCFGEPTSNQQRQFILGWACISWIVLVIILNISVIWTIKILRWIKECKEWLEIHKSKSKRTPVQQFENSVSLPHNEASYRSSTLDTQNRILTDQERYALNNLESPRLGEMMRAQNMVPDQVLRLNHAPPTQEDFSFRGNIPE